MSISSKYYLIQEDEIKALTITNDDMHSNLKTVNHNYNELELSLNHQKDYNKKLSIELKVLSECWKENKDKNERITKEISRQIDRNKELESKLNTVVSEYEELKAKHYDMFEEKEKSEGLRKKQVLELDFLRRASKDYNANLLQMQSTNNEIKLAIYSCISVSKIFINKLSLTSYENDVYSRNYSENVPKLQEEINRLQHDSNLIFSIKILEELIRVICVEVEVFFIFI